MSNSASPVSSAQAVLEVRGLSKRFAEGGLDVSVLQAVNLTVAAGASIAPSNGAATTLTLNATGTITNTGTITGGISNTGTITTLIHLKMDCLSLASCLLITT